VESKLVVNVVEMILNPPEDWVVVVVVDVDVFVVDFIVKDCVVAFDVVVDVLVVIFPVVIFLVVVVVVVDVVEDKLGFEVVEVITVDCTHGDVVEGLKKFNKSLCQKNP